MRDQRGFSIRDDCRRTAHHVTPEDMLSQGSALSPLSRCLVRSQILSIILANIKRQTPHIAALSSPFLLVWEWQPASARLGWCLFFFINITTGRSGAPPPAATFHLFKMFETKK